MGSLDRRQGLHGVTELPVVYLADEPVRLDSLCHLTYDRENFGYETPLFAEVSTRGNDFRR